MNSTSKNLVKILIVLLISGSMFFVPFDALGISLTFIQVGVVALFVMAALMWILEPIPIWTTSVLVIALSLFCLSNKSLTFLRPDRYDVNAVYAVIDAACGPEADAEAVDSLKKAVRARLDKKPSLNADEVRMTLGYQIMDVSEKAGAAARNIADKNLDEAGRSELAALSRDGREYAAAVMRLYEPETNSRMAALSFGADGAPYDKAAVDSIVDGLFQAGADESCVDRLKRKIAGRLDEKAVLNSGEVAMTIGYQIMAARAETEHRIQTLLEKAGAKLDDGDKVSAMRLRKNQRDFAAAAANLYTAGIAESIRELKFVNVMQQKSTMATFADPIIILFLGGFFLAAAATKYRLDINLAKVLLKPFGTNPKYVMLGLMSVTALFAMFMSNTATTAMMLAILTPVLALFPSTDRGRIAFALCVPVAANIGGIGTPIGTPPNAIALKAMQDMGLNVTFGQWMFFGVPFVVVLLLFAWLLLIKLFPIEQKELRLEMGGRFLKTPKAIIVYVTFIATVLLWVFGEKIGLDSNTVAIVPIAVFSVTQVISKEDLKAMSWDVLWLVAGGFALGLALQETGLAKDMVNAIPFASWNTAMLFVGASLICIFMSTFMSNTATASLLMPILAAVGGSMVGAGAMDNGGCISLLCCVAISASLAMALPISTPPNALAYASGFISNRDMAVSGLILGVVGLALTIVIMTVLSGIGFFAS